MATTRAEANVEPWWGGLLSAQPFAKPHPAACKDTRAEYVCMPPSRHGCLLWSNPL